MSIIDSIAKLVMDGLNALKSKDEAEITAVEKRVTDYIDGKIAALRAEIVGSAEAAASAAVSDLQATVEAIKPAPVAAAPNAPAQGASA